MNEKSTHRKLPEFKLIDDLVNKNDLVSQIVNLADQNTETLGFVPEQALQKAAKERRLIAAVDPQLGVLGYAWYSSSRRDVARIHHLCVAETARKSGIGQRLVQEIKERTQSRSCIVLNCRRDFDAHRFWPKMGFVAIGEKPGRGKQETTLTEYRFDHGNPTLFSDAVRRITETTITAVLDANIIFDLADKLSTRHGNAMALRADWISDRVSYWRTNELLNEINRNEDSRSRKERRKVANEFVALEFDRSEYEASLREVLDVLQFTSEQPDSSDSKHSDARHLAECVAAGADIFISRDGQLIKRAIPLRESKGLWVTTPVDFILYIDEALRGKEYEPARLAGSQLTLRQIGSGQMDALYGVFRSDEGETKPQFVRAVETAIGPGPSSTESLVVRKGEDMLALAVMQHGARAIEIPILRTARGRLGPTVARALLANVLRLRACHDTVIRVTEAKLAPVVRDACLELKFRPCNAALVKIFLHGLFDRDALPERVDALVGPIEDCSGLSQIIRGLVTEPGLHASLVLEDLLWPARKREAAVESYLVPIKPKWAKQLFDEMQARGDLFGVDPTLFLSYENVYYMGGPTRQFKTPARLLWYVTKDKTERVREVRACSTLRYVAHEEARQLYSRFARLGSYSWNDVLQCAGGECDRRIYALYFDSTYMLPRPLRAQRLQAVLKRSRGVVPQFTTTLRLREGEFDDIFELGTEVPS